MPTTTRYQVQQCPKCFLVSHGELSQTCPMCRQKFKKVYIYESYHHEHKPEETKTMTNYSTAVMLFNDQIRAMRVSYDPNDLDSKTQKARDYIFKTLDPDIKGGDFVTIPTDTRHKMTVAKVEESDVEVDYDSSLEIKWIISRVPTEEYAGILADEQQWISEMKKAQNRKKKEDIKNSMLEMYKADGASLETLAIAGRKAAPTCAVITGNTAAEVIDAE